MIENLDRTIFWHRRDLRAIDNAGLHEAAAADTVIPVFCFDDAILKFAGAPRVAFMLEALADLRSWYRERESDLVVLRGDPDVEIPAFAADHDVDTAVWNHDYSGLATERDEAVEDALLADDVDTTWVHDAVLFEPGSIRTSTGDPYSVFSYYWKKWRDREKDAPVDLPSQEVLADVDGESIPTLSDLGFESPTATLPTATRKAAVERLHEFLERPVFEYADTRDVPSIDGTSRLSPDLKFGLLGIREVFEATEGALDSADSKDERESVREFQRQLAWREFYAQVLAFNPETVSENFKTYANPVEWTDDEAALEAWQHGRTGYPIVDAGMRQLQAEGFMHNRVRMIVASFLTKDLHIDWREGYRWFREHLVDHDTANDVGGWQWAASTGTDAQPYFRIFNPMTQGERYDPDGEYIREYVDELQGVDAETIHDWTDLSVAERDAAAPDYPAPIVDHATRREQAIDLFERARGDD